MALSNSKIFLCCLVALNIGLGFGFNIEKNYMAYLAMFFVAIFTIFWRNRFAAAICLAGLFFVSGVTWAHHKQPQDLSSYFGKKKIAFEGLIVTDPEVKEKSHTFIAELNYLEGDNIRTKIAVVMPKYPQFEYGTKLRLQGELEEVSEFNFKDNVSAQVIFPKVVRSEIGHGNPIKHWLYDLKRKLLSDINQMLSAPESGLLGGLLLGTKEMSDELLEQFRITGTSHIIAVSGFNVTIVAVFLDKIFRSFGRSVSFYASILGIAGFVIITGATASVVRAGIMGSLVLIAQYFGRIYASVNALFLTSAVMLFQNPKLLQFDIGFQLSFAALAGLMFVQPLFEDRFPNSNIVLSTIFPTIAAQITTAPLILYHFGNLSLISILTNLLVLPGIPLGMLLGAISLAMYLIIPAVGAIAGSTIWLLLYYIIWVINWTSKIPLASLNHIPFPLFALVVYYFLLSAFLVWKQKQKNFLSI